MPDQDKRDYYNRRTEELRLHNNNMTTHYKQLSNFVLPRRGRFDINEVNQTSTPSKWKAIINSRATTAHDIARAGMFAGTMSPARPWFALSLADREKAEFKPVAIWLQSVAAKMRNVMNQTNLYTMAPTMIGEMILFGTGAMTHDDDPDTVARFYAHTAGTYYIGQDAKLEVNTFIREYMMTAEQMVREFGEENVSKSVKNAVDTNKFESMFKVVHVIEPNDDFKPDNPFSEFKKYASVKYEPGNTNRDQFLSKKGYDDKPFYVPRWETTGEDLYATNCPAMTALGDIKGLQLEEKRKAQAIDKKVNPPLSGPASLRNVPVNSLPGGLTLYNSNSAQNKLEAVYAVNLDIRDLKEDMDAVERRINEAFHVDLFRAITDMEGIQPRNELELQGRDAERLLQLGPVLERMFGELDNLITRIFNQMNRRGMIPPPPPELEGEELQIEYISSLALAQRAVDTRPIERLAQFASSLVGANLSDGAKFDGDAALDKYAELLGAPAELLRSDKELQALREADAQAAQAAQSMEMLESGARAARDAGQVDLGASNPVAAAVERINEV